MSLWDPADPINPTFMGGVATFGETWDAARDAQIYAHNTTMTGEALERAYDDRIAAIKEATGATLTNPAREPRRPLARGPDALAGWVDPFERFRTQLGELAEKYPDRAELFGPVDMLAAGQAVSRSAEERAAVTLGSRGDAAGYLAAFGGGFSGSLRDPIQTALLFAGGGVGGGTTVAGRILATAAREAAINAGSEAALQPLIQPQRAAAGLPSGFGEAAMDVAMAGAFGAVFGAGARSIGEGVSALRARYGADLADAPPAVRGAAAALEADGALDAHKPHAPVGPEVFDSLAARAIAAAEEPERIGALAADDSVRVAMARAVADPGAITPADGAALLATRVNGATPRAAFDALARADATPEAPQSFALGDPQVTIRAMGELGPVAEGFDGRWPEAVVWLKHWGGGEVASALEHPSVGRIDVPWGYFDGASDSGMGLAAIVARRPDIVNALPERLAAADVLSREPDRVRLGSKDLPGVVRLDYDAAAKSWLMTAIEPKAGRSGATAKAGEPRGEQVNPRREIAAGQRPAARDAAFAARIDDSLTRREAQQPDADASADGATPAAGDVDAAAVMIPGDDGLMRPLNDVLDEARRQDGVAGLVESCRTEG